MYINEWAIKQKEKPDWAKKIVWKAKVDKVKSESNLNPRRMHLHFTHCIFESHELLWKSIYTHISVNRSNKRAQLINYVHTSMFGCWGN